MAKTEIVAYHGWGFDAGCWNVWKRYISPDYTFLTYDRGYFGKPDNPEFSPETDNRIILTHSFGLHLCPSKMMQQADLLIIFGGFLDFHPKAARFRRRSRLVLNQMIARFSEEPDKLLEDFYKNVFHPQEGWQPPQQELNSGLLLDDLVRLNEVEISLKRLNKIPKVCILHGSEDYIVPKSKGRELNNKLHSSIAYLEVKKAGHALPFTHTEQCWSFIQPEAAHTL